MIAPPSYLLHYILQGLVGISVTFGILAMICPFRRPSSPALWWGYLLAKTIGDAFLYYALGHGGAGTWLEAFQAAWTSILGVMSLLIAFQTFDGDLVSIGACAILCDLCAGICTSLGLIVSSAVSGEPLDTGYVRPFGVWTMICVITTLVSALCVSRPMVMLIRWLVKMLKRNRFVWGSAAFALIATTVGITQRLGTIVSVANYMANVGPLVFVVMTVAATLLLVRARDVRHREQAVRACAALAVSYAGTIRTQLTALEEELSALEGNDRVLSVLQSGEGEEAEKVRRLKRTYQRLCTGAYCDRPALDAVLTAGAQRLHGMGVEPSFTVAGVPTQAVMLATVVLTLFNIACEAAGRTDSVKSEAVELRVRGIGEQLLFRLSVPARWGELWARRALSPFDVNDTMLVRERRQNNRTVVLVLDEGVAA